MRYVGGTGRGGCQDAATPLEAQLFLVAGKVMGRSWPPAICMWVINRYGDTDKIGWERQVGGLPIL